MSYIGKNTTYFIGYAMVSDSDNIYLTSFIPK